LNKNVALTSLAWGLFFVMIGVSLAMTGYGITFETIIPCIAVGTGIILIGLNVARTGLGMELNKFSLFIGILAFVLGGLAVTGYLETLPWYAIVIILIGLFIIAEAVRALAKSK
jgi:peptidoglycan/LPS O-acetylase OafA/YrhL